MRDFDISPADIPLSQRRMKLQDGSIASEIPAHAVGSRVAYDRQSGVGIAVGQGGAHAALSPNTLAPLLVRSKPLSPPPPVIQRTPCILGLHLTWNAPTLPDEQCNLDVHCVCLDVSGVLRAYVCYPSPRRAFVFGDDWTDAGVYTFLGSVGAHDPSTPEGYAFPVSENLFVRCDRLPRLISQVIFLADVYTYEAYTADTWANIPADQEHVIRVTKGTRVPGDKILEQVSPTEASKGMILGTFTKDGRDWTWQRAMTECQDVGDYVSATYGAVVPFDEDEL